VELAKQEVQRISDLVDAGALPRIRIDEANAGLADALDDAILQNPLLRSAQDRLERPAR
jgi:hypothetical protein